MSIIDDYLVFTTKKNGSRYFEDISEDVDHFNRSNTLNVDLHNIGEWPSDDVYKLSNFIFEKNPSTRIDEYLFLNLLGINKFGELFSDKVSQKFKFIFIVRDPIQRFFTGFFEKVDGILGELEKDSHLFFTYGILKNHFNINEFTSLSNLPQDKINLILNEYTRSIDYRIFNDQHLSLWNYFLLDFLKKEDAINKVKIIDLNDTNSMSVFKKLPQPTNKPWLDRWLNDDKNKKYIDDLLLKFKNYFDLEIESYNILLNKNG